MDDKVVGSERLLSIVIATRNRTVYAVKTVRALLKMPDSCFEVIVQDNSDKADFMNLAVDFLEDDRLCYRYTPPPFSSIDNFNAGIALAKGRYVCLIGDDDGVSKQLINAVRWADVNGIDCLVGSINLEYRWPGVASPEQDGGIFVIQHFSGEAKSADYKSALLRLIARGGVNYLDLPLPKLYHGVVKRACLDKVKRLTGNYLGGLSPDIYSAVALSLVIEKLVTVDFPLTIPGICTQSTSVTEGRNGAFSFSVSDAPHWRSREEYVWNKEVPSLYCATTIWADSCVSALKEMGRHDLVKRFGSRRLLEEIYWIYPQARPFLQKYEISEAGIWGRTAWKLKMNFRLLTGPMLIWIVKNIKKVVLRLSGRRAVISDISDIYEAMERMEMHLRQSRVSMRFMK